MLVLVLTSVVLAGTSTPFSASHQLPAPNVELAQLQAQIASMKAAGQAVDPALSAKARELTIQLQSQPATVAEVVQAVGDNGFGATTVIRPQELTTLEEQIQSLEMQLMNGLGGVVDDVTYGGIKSQLGELYAQRPQNRERNPLDQGADVCPATLINGVPYTDTGSTVGMANNYEPISICGTAGHSPSPDVVYEFRPPYTGYFSVTLCGSLYDTYVWINTGGACPGATQIACNDDACGVQSAITSRFEYGTIYYIVVDGWSNSSGAYTISVSGICDVSCYTGYDVPECTGDVIAPGQEVTNCNGGCDNVFHGGVETYDVIYPCQSFCGSGFNYVTEFGADYRDVDVFRVTLTEACSLAVTVLSEIGCQVVVASPPCPWNFNYVSPTWVYACSTVTFVTECLPPGDYDIAILPPFQIGVNSFSDYRGRVDVIPCNGCRIDTPQRAPFTVFWNTCGEGNHNSLRPSEDYTICVMIPHESDWTFSLCSGVSVWDSYLYLSTQCSGGVIAADDDGCGGVGLSTINCVHLLPGSYYLTVEAFSNACGPFTLNVTECLGRCCYGDPIAPLCDFITQAECSQLSGVWTSQTPCSVGVCVARPVCGDGTTILSQLPPVPTENWDAVESDLNGPYRAYEDYSVSSAIGTIRFWGVFGPQECNVLPQDFEIAFIDSVNNVSQTYNVTLTATVLPHVYFNYYSLLEYTAELSPPCTIANGWVSIAETSLQPCNFNWSWTVLGNGQLGYLTNSSNPDDPIIQLGSELAFCLSAGCVAPDSVTIRTLTNFPDAYSIRWWQPAGVVRAWWSTDPTAVFPATYTELFSLDLPEGSYSNAFFAPVPSSEVIYVMTMECGAPPPAAGNSSDPAFKVQEETK